VEKLLFWSKPGEESKKTGVEYEIFMGLPIFNDFLPSKVRISAVNNRTASHNCHNKGAVNMSPERQYQQASQLSCGIQSGFEAG